MNKLVIVFLGILIMPGILWAEEKRWGQMDEETFKKELAAHLHAFAKKRQDEGLSRRQIISEVAKERANINALRREKMAKGSNHEQGDDGAGEPKSSDAAKDDSQKPKGDAEKRENDPRYQDHKKRLHENLIPWFKGDLKNNPDEVEALVQWYWFLFDETAGMDKEAAAQKRTMLKDKFKKERFKAFKKEFEFRAYELDFFEHMFKEKHLQYAGRELVLASVREARIKAWDKHSREVGKKYAEKMQAVFDKAKMVGLQREHKFNTLKSIIRELSRVHEEKELKKKIKTTKKTELKRSGFIKPEMEVASDYMDALFEKGKYPCPEGGKTWEGGGWGDWKDKWKDRDGDGGERPKWPPRGGPGRGPRGR